MNTAYHISKPRNQPLQPPATGELVCSEGTQKGEEYLPSSSLMAARWQVFFSFLKELRKEKNTCHLAAIRLQPLPTVNLEETGI